MHTKEDDIVVIQQVLQGRHAAYAILVERYRQYVFSLALKYAPEREQAEELAQDVFVKAFRNLASYRGESKFSTWLYTIVHTTCLSHLRKKGSGIVFMEQDKITTLQDTLQHDAPNVLLEQNSRKVAINQAMQHLPDADAQVLSLFYIASQSVEEISAITGITVSNVKVRLFRARNKLKEIIETKYKHELLN